MDRNNRTVPGPCCGRERSGEVGRAHTRGDGRRDDCLCTSQPISYAMAYVRDQVFENLFSPEEALGRGTLFADLYLPYCAGVGRR